MIYFSSRLRNQPWIFFLLFTSDYSPLNSIFFYCSLVVVDFGPITKMRTKARHVLQSQLENLEENVKFKGHLEKEQLYDFLANLKKDQDEVQGKHLGWGLLPSIGDTFLEVQQEENRRCAMLGRKKDLLVIISRERLIETIA